MKFVLKLSFPLVIQSSWYLNLELTKIVKRFVDKNNNNMGNENMVIF